MSAERDSYSRLRLLCWILANPSLWMEHNEARKFLRRPPTRGVNNDREQWWVGRNVGKWKSVQPIGNCSPRMKSLSVVLFKDRR